MSPGERSHPVDASRNRQDEAINRYRAGYRNGRASLRRDLSPPRPPTPPPPTGGNRDGGEPRSGRVLILIIAAVLLAALCLIWRIP